MSKEDRGDGGGLRLDRRLRARPTCPNGLCGGRSVVGDDSGSGGSVLEHNSGVAGVGGGLWESFVAGAAT